MQSVSSLSGGRGDDVRVAEVHAENRLCDVGTVRGDEALRCQAPPAEIDRVARGADQDVFHPGRRADRQSVAALGRDEPLGDRAVGVDAHSIAAHLGGGAADVPVVYEPLDLELLGEDRLTLGNGA